jgi:hypothetical protein
MCGNVAPMYDGHHFWFWYPGRDYTVWFDTPITAEQLESGNVCYRLNGNVWFCPTQPADTLPPEVTPLPTNAHIKPMISVTSVKMENHPDHISVMFGQVLNNLK